MIKRDLSYYFESQSLNLGPILPVYQSVILSLSNDTEVREPGHIIFPLTPVSTLPLLFLQGRGYLPKNPSTKETSYQSTEASSSLTLKHKGGESCTRQPSVLSCSTLLESLYGRFASRSTRKWQHAWPCAGLLPEVSKRSILLTKLWGNVIFWTSGKRTRE